MTDRILALAERSSKVELSVDDKFSRRKKQALAKREQAERKQFLRERKLARRTVVSVKTPKPVVKAVTRDRNRARHEKRAGAIKYPFEQEYLEEQFERYGDIDHPFFDSSDDDRFYYCYNSCNCGSRSCIECSMFNCQCNLRSCIECSTLYPNDCQSDDDLPFYPSSNLNKRKSHAISCFWFDENDIEDDDSFNCRVCSPN